MITEQNNRQADSGLFEPLVRQKLFVRGIELKDANKFILEFHRHHDKVQGHKFSLGCFNDKNELVGIAVVGRPVSRILQDGKTLEVTRLCTDGTKWVVSKLLGACGRITKEMGFDLITYILQSETGISLKASGWELDEICKGDTLSKSKNRNRTNLITDLFGTKTKYPAEPKQRWRKKFSA